MGRDNRLALPLELGGVHPVFHVSMLRKYLPDSSHVIQPQEVQLDTNLAYEKTPIAILERQVRKLRSKEIPLVKVAWRNHSGDEATWEVEADMRQNYPSLFEN